MSSTWRRLDSTIALTPMPPEYANIDVRVSVVYNEHYVLFTTSNKIYLLFAFRYFVVIVTK